MKEIMLAIALMLVSCRVSKDRSLDVCRSVGEECIPVTTLVAEFRASPDQAVDRWGYRAGRRLYVSGRHLVSRAMSGAGNVRLGDESEGVAQCATGPVDARWSTDTFLIVQTEGVSFREGSPPTLNLGYCSVVRAE